MTDEDLFNLFWSFHRERLLTFAVKAAFGNWEDAEEGLNDAMRELWPNVVKHFEAVSMEDRTDARRSILPGLWGRVRSRVWDARRRSLRHEKPLGQSVVQVAALDDEPAKTGHDSTDAARKRAEKLFASKVAEGKAEALFLSKWNRLSEVEKKVFKLTILREPPMTDDEAAKEIGTTPGTVKARRCSALRKLSR
jgi:DNA-directed RNA polymerase specialized sigma24 family protein